MVHTFATREEAAIFASAMRSDGYLAEILDEGMGSIYGPLTIGGIRVLVSDESIGDADDGGETEFTVPPPPDVKPDDGEFLTVLRLLTVGIAALGLAVVVVMLLSAHARNPGELVRTLFRVLKYPLMIGLAFAVMGPWMGDFTRWLRGEPSGEGQRYLRWLLLALLIPFLLLVVL